MPQLPVARGHLKQSVPSAPCSSCGRSASQQIVEKYDFIDQTEEWRGKYLAQGTVRSTSCKVALSIDWHVQNLDSHANHRT
jgi:hypothetical protein